MWGLIDFFAVLSTCGFFYFNNSLSFKLKEVANDLNQSAPKPRACCDDFTIIWAFSNPALRFSFNEVLEHTLHLHGVLRVGRAVISMAESGIITITIIITIIIISSSALEP